ncbi:YHS domain-containing protein [Haladaptatus sp. DFWS20]
MAECPVCGMEVDANDPPAQTEYEGEMYVFCEGMGCKEKFEDHPERYT